MGKPFDPYHKWLGISPAEQPPNHYRLLGINLWESDPDVIAAAADRQMGHVRTYQTGPHAAASQKLLNELAAARVCLLSAEKKAAYDRALYAAMAARSEAAQVAGPSAVYYLRDAARYLAVQAERFWVWQFRLPAAFGALGEEVYRRGAFRDRLPDLFAKLDAMSKDLRALDEAGSPGPEPPPEAQGFSGALKGAFRAIQQSARRASLGQRRGRLLRALGCAAYQLDAPSSGPEHLTSPVRDALERLAHLRAQAVQLAEVPPGQVLSPQRLAWLVVGMVGILLLFVFWLRLAALVRAWF